MLIYINKRTITPRRHDSQCICTNADISNFINQNLTQRTDKHDIIPWVFNTSLLSIGWLQDKSQESNPSVNLCHRSNVLKDIHKIFHPSMQQLGKTCYPQHLMKYSLKYISH